MSQVEQDIKNLTANIVDAPSKLHLRSVIATTLVRDLDHSWDVVEPALDRFFVPGTVH